MIEHYHDSNGRKLATVVRGSDKYLSGLSNGVEFFTDPSDLIQVGVIAHPYGHRIQPHTHADAPRSINMMTEVILMQKGEMRVTLYGDGWEYQELSVWEGDCLILFAGGHGFEMKMDSRFIEVKQGPYLGVKDKRNLIIETPHGKSQQR